MELNILFITIVSFCLSFSEVANGQCKGLPVQDEGVELSCSYNRRNVACNSATLPSGTRASFKCLQYYIKPQGINSRSITCRRNKWIGIKRLEQFRCSIDCGNPIRYQSRIVNGSLTRASKWPWHATIFIRTPETNSYEYKCGGSLIGPIGPDYFVVSAAHCFISKDNFETIRKENIQIVIGSASNNYEQERKNQNAQISNVREFITHEFFNSNGISNNDIAIVLLDKPVQLSPNVLPICVRDEEKSLPLVQIGQEVHVVGFGIFDVKNGFASSTLRQVKLPVVAHSNCDQWRGSEFLPSELCAGYIGGPATCDGDSGGGLVFEQNKNGNLRYFLEGIVSHGEGGDAADDENFTTLGLCDNYGVYTRVSSFIDWIYRNSEELMTIISEEDVGDDDENSKEVASTVAPQEVASTVAPQEIASTLAPQVQQEFSNGAQIEAFKDGCHIDTCTKHCFPKGGVCEQRWYNWKYTKRCKCDPCNGKLVWGVCVKTK